MEIKRVTSSTPLLNSETENRERRKYDPHFQYLNSPSSENIKVPTKEEVKEMVGQINKFLKENNTSIRYEYHEKLNSYYVKVVDTFTEDVVREIPPKKLLDLYAYIRGKTGLIIDKKA